MVWTRIWTFLKKDSTLHLPETDKQWKICQWILVYKETSKAEGSKPIYFTNQFPGNTASLKFVNNGVIIDNEELNKQIGAVKAAGGDLGAALAKSVADKLTAGMNFGNVSESDSSLTPDSSVKIDDLGS